LDFTIYIKELLVQHDCVILPGLGGFVANYKPAEFDPARNTASPPGKHILFNKNLVHNDGLLYAHISEASGYGYKDVQDMATSFFEGIRRDIKKGMKFEIDGLGYFYQDKEGQVQFTEESGSNFLLESYGLPFLQYREIEKPKIESYRSATSEIHPLDRQRRIRRWAYGTAAACLLAAMLVVPMKTGYFTSQETPTLNQASLAATIMPAATSYQTAAEYNIVVGSFKDFGHARVFRNNVISKGYPARILCITNGTYRVTAGTFTEQNEAKVELAFVLSDFDDAWVLSN